MYSTSARRHDIFDGEWAVGIFYGAQSALWISNRGLFGEIPEWTAIPVATDDIYVFCDNEWWNVLVRRRPSRREAVHWKRGVLCGTNSRSS